MKKLFDSVFDYANAIQFESKLSLEASTQKLSEITKKNYPHVAILSAVRASQLTGKVTAEKVVLHRVRPLVGNVYGPYFVGKFISHDGKVLLEGKFTMNNFAKTAITLGLFVVVIFEVIVVISTFGSSETSNMTASTLQVLFLPAIASIALGVLLLIKKWSGKDVEWMSDRIQEALSGN